MLLDNPREYRLHSGATGQNRIPGSGVQWTYRINADGFRGEEFDLQSGSKRILFVGHSYTFDWGVNPQDTLPRALERVLA
ncbi:MAG: hypothetical protein HRT77_02760 [Halioglobus sp.]|nr:hypothetical protein [Halioglobus sp.]